MAGHADPPPLYYVWHLARGLLAAELLLLGTWNPFGVSYLKWAWDVGAATPLLVLVGLVLLIGHVALGRIAFVALGPSGIIATLVVLGCALLAAWRAGAADIGWLPTQPVFWLTGWAAILASGMTWTKLQKRISGQRGVLKNPP